MVHGLAEQSGGRLWLESQPGHGARIEIWLPQAKTVGSRAAVDPSAVHADDRSRRSLVVLAVDDDSLVLTNMAAMLEDLGHRAVGASSAAEALAALGDDAVDLVITVYAMPEMTGLQLADEIAACRPNLPVVLATGYAELPPGAALSVPRISKPFRQEQLLEVVARVMEGPRFQA
jgi:CheY-like chemotaxis protein